MGMQYQYGARRRRVLVWATTPPPPSPPPNPPSRPTILVVPAYARPRTSIRIAANVHRAVTPADVVSIPRPRPTFVVPLDPAPRRPPPGAILVRAEYAPAAPPPPPSPPTPRQVVVPTVSIKYQGGNRRRRVIVVTTTMPNTSPGTTAAALNRVTIVRRHPALPAPPSNYVRSTQTRVVLGGDPPVHNGGGGSPRPLQASWIIGTIREHFPRPMVRAIITRTRFTPPARDGFPNQVVVVAPHHVVAKRAAVIVRPAFKWGLNAGKTPNPPVVVGRPVARRVPQPIVVFSPPTSGLGFHAVVRPVVVPAQRRRPGLAPIIAHGPADTRTRIRCLTLVAPRPTPRRSAPVAIVQSTWDAFAVRPPRAVRPIIIPYAKYARPRGKLVVYGLADAFEMPPPTVMRPIVVARRVPIRTAAAIVVSITPSVSPRSIPVFGPIVVPIPRGRAAAPWVFTSQFLKFTVPPPRHDPRPTPTFVRIPRRRVPLMWPPPHVATSILQPDDERFDKPWDLIAACIARLRADPAIVASFGDVKGSEAAEKFVSDVELPKTDLPYAVFDEPMEVESYESMDASGRIPSLVEGFFQLTIFDREKQGVRRLADATAAALHDAPLVFSDGVLIHLRRTERRFPIVKVGGSGQNVTMFKREIEFEYKIGRHT